jgi:hypothetical protein
MLATHFIPMLTTPFIRPLSRLIMASSDLWLVWAMIARAPTLALAAAVTNPLRTLCAHHRVTVFHSQYFLPCSDSSLAYAHLSRTVPERIKGQL